MCRMTCRLRIFTRQDGLNFFSRLTVSSFHHYDSGLVYICLSICSLWHGHQCVHLIVEGLVSHASTAIQLSTQLRLSGWGSCALSDGFEKTGFTETDALCYPTTSLVSSQLTLYMAGWCELSQCAQPKPSYALPCLE